MADEFCRHGLLNHECSEVAVSDPIDAEVLRPLVEKYPDRWISNCQRCTWSSAALPFNDPDSALHALSLHKVLCKG